MNVSKDLAGLLVDVSALKFDPKNTQVHNRSSIESIKQSLDHVGQRKPIVVMPSTMTVICGNGTLEAAMELGWTQIAATMFDGTADQAKALAILDNRTQQHAEWDLDNLLDAFNDLPDLAPEELGFYGAEVDDLFAGIKEKVIDDKPEKPVQETTCPYCNASFVPTKNRRS